MDDEHPGRARVNVLWSPWIILPLTLVGMLIVSAHVTIIQHTPAHPTRRRLRICNGWIMLITLPLLGAGVSLVSPSRQPRLFALTWLTVILLLIVSILIALADTLNTIRLTRADRRRHLESLFSSAAERPDE